MMRKRQAPGEPLTSSCASSAVHHTALLCMCMCIADRSSRARLGGGRTGVDKRPQPGAQSFPLAPRSSLSLLGGWTHLTVRP